MGVWPLVVALRCSGDDPGGSGGGASGEGGESAGESGGGSKTAGGPPTAGKAGGGGTPVAGTGGSGPPTAGAAGIAGTGGSAEGGGSSCIDDVGAMPPSPLVPAAAECASGCSVPPFDGVTLPAGCGDGSNEPPAAALSENLGGVPPGGLIVSDIGEPPQQNGPPMTGAPCDVGWCASVVPTELAIGVSTSSGPYTEHTAMKPGSGELVHLARAQDLISFDYVTVNPTSIASRTELDPENWADYMESPVPGQSGGWLSFGNPQGPVIGVDPRPGQNHVYVAYASVEPQFIGAPVTGPRFGVVVGDSPGFEDLPAGWDALTNIQVDENGDAIVLQKGRVYRHVASGSWEEVAVHCSITAVGDLAIDTENAVWYLMSSGGMLYRRAADGSWTKTASPGGKLVLAGGTVHLVSGQSVVHRVGNEWSQPLVAPLGDSGGATPVRVAVDSCWAPHAAAAYMYDTNYLFEMDYTRWTSRGFLTLRRVSNDYPGVELAVTAGHVFVHGGGGMFVLPAH